MALTNGQKIEILSNTPEMMAAVKMLTAAFNEMELKSFIRMHFNININSEEPGMDQQQFEVVFQKVHTHNYD